MKKSICLMMAVVMVAVSAVFMLTGCRSGGEGEVYVYSYGDYFDPAIAEQFEDETGIHVVIDSYDTAEEMYTVIENGATSYDCICTSDYMIEKMISNDMLAPLDYTNIPNSENIEAVYMEKSDVFDPGNKYSIPYQVGTAGIIYNKGMVGGEKIDSWEDLWNKKFADQMVMPDSVRDAFMIALRKHGYSQNTTDPKEIKTAAKDLIKQKPLVYKYANDSARDLLADGSAAVGVVWNGEYIYTKDLNEDVEFIIPKEGSEFFIDSWVVPKDAVNKENAEKWIDFLSRGDIAAQNFDYLYYTTPNKAAKEIIDKKYLDMEAVFPTDETIGKCDSLRMLDPETTEIYSNYWKEIKAN